MCGIAGMYNFHNADLQPQYFKWCLSTMKNRGPDGQKSWDNEKNYITVFARLAIRDLSSNGDQPMLSEDKQFCISFNGEIYNTDLLKQLLKPYREKFHSTSDTELLLYSLIYLGIEKTLSTIDGMFAFAFYNLLKNELVLARDRVGIKPLYVGTSLQGVVYSSQYDHVINHSYFKNETINEAIVASYLFLGYMAEGKGIINNTQLLPHGSYLVVKNNVVNKFNYYNYPVSTFQKSIDADDIIEKSVGSQLVSDVSLGTFMSGGVDSTLVTYFANKKQHIKSFTIGIEDEQMNEANEATQFADMFKTEHFTKYITPKNLSLLLCENAAAFSEPFADYSSLPMLMLAAFAKKKITVALSGDGGDELFWGYNRNIKALQLFSLYKKNMLGKKVSLLSKKIRNFSYVDVSRHWDTSSFLDYYYSSLSITGALKWLPEVCNIKPEFSPFFIQSAKDAGLENNIENNMNMIRKMEIDIHLQRILLKVDRTAMHHSLEVRVPFLSNGMLDYSATLNYKDCIENNEGKINLKKSLIQKTNSHLVHKPKKGFTVPVNEWLRKELKKEVHEKVMNIPDSLSSIFNKKKIEDLLNQHSQGLNNDGWFIWALYSLVQWNNIHRRKI